MRRWAILSVVGVLFCSLSLDAQVLTGTLLGVVRDESRAVLPGVNVTIVSPALAGGPVSAVTDAQGQYRFANLQPGIYEMTIALSGFTTYVEKDLRVAVGGTTERDVRLTVASVAETITVSGQAPVVDPRQVGVARSLASDAVEAIPHNRQGGLGAFAVTLPGVVSSNYGRVGTGVYVMGSNATETSYMVDGMNTNHVASGASYGYFSMDAIEEISMTTLGASAEYQQAQGGVMNMVTKAGNNRWRGDGVKYWAPPALTSAPFDLPCNCPLGRTGFKLYKYRDYGFHAGGPIVKDHIWYFGGVSDAGPSARNPGAPDTPPDFQWIRNEARSTHKGTFKINDKLTFNQVFYYEWWFWSNPDFPTITNPLSTVQWYTGDIRMNGSEMTATLTNRTVLTARYNINSMPYGDTGFSDNLLHDSASLNIPGRIDLVTGVSSGNTTSAPADAYQPRRDEANVKLNHYFSGHGASHNLRYGFQWGRNAMQAQNVWPGGVLYQDSGGAPRQAQFIPPSYYAARYDQEGLWVEDEINKGRVTITPGLRFDRMSAFSQDADVVDPTVHLGSGGLCRCVQGFPKTGETIPGLGQLFTWNKVAPRVGINYKLTEDGKTILRATTGRYYRPIFLNDFTAIHPALAPITLKGWDPVTGDYTTLISVTDAKRNLGIDPDVRPPYTNQYSVGVDREVARNIGVSVTFVHKDSHDQIGWQDVGGVYGTQTVVAPTGQTVTVLPLLNSTSERKFLRTNGPDFFSRYNGIVTSLTRRMANRWMLSFAYTYSRTEGLEVAPSSSNFASTTGQDPNDYVNFTGRLSPNDRPNVFNATGAYEIPKVAVQFSANLTLTEGLPYGAQVQVRLPQGTRNVYFAPPGDYRTPNGKWLHLRAQKILLRHGPRYIEAGVELRNALQEKGIDSISSRVFTASNFGQPNTWAVPRQVLFRVRGYF